MIKKGIIVFHIGNAIEPEVDSELDFYEAASSAGIAAHYRK